MTDTSLTISWPGGQLTAKPGSEVTIGRDPDCSIVLTSAAVSRHHARIWYEDGEWRFDDQNSTQGSFAGSDAVHALVISEPTGVALGQGQDAVLLSLAPILAVTRPLAAEPTRAANGRVMAVAAAGTVGPEVQRPGGALADDAIGAPTVVPATNDERAIELTTGSTTIALRPGQTANLGRDDDNDLVVADPTVSRHQLRIEHDGTSWQLVDLASAAGTWLDDNKVGRVTLAGQQTFTLGDRHGTTTLRTAAPHTNGSAPEAPDTDRARGQVDPSAPVLDRPRSSRTGLVAALVVVALVVVAGLGGGAWWLTHRGVDSNKLAQGTVLIALENGAHGSGTIIDAKNGLILTNAHVAAPHAMGTGVRKATIVETPTAPDASQPLTISIASGLDKSAEPRFIAQVVAADGYLDLAVIKIVKTAAGAAVEADDLKGLVEVPIGDSGKVRSGDNITVIGYPSVAHSLAPTLTEGVVSGVQDDPRMNINNALINLDARINPGNSGGLAADSSGELVGVPSLGLLDPQTGESQLFAMHPVSFAAPLIAAAQKGARYVSPWTKDAPSSATITKAALSAPHNEEVLSGCDSPEGTSVEGVYSYGIEYTGFPTGANTDLIGVISAANDEENTPLRSAVTSYPTALPAQGCVTLTFLPSRNDSPLPDGAYTLQIGLGGNHKALASYDLLIGAQAGTTDTAPGTGGDGPPPG